MKIIFAQGNPEDRYTLTRHNIGWRIIDALAEEQGASWKVDKKHGASLAIYTEGGEKILLAKPLSYYNDTGRVAHSLLHFYKLSPQDLLVIHDDLALPFGTLRVRKQGSDAGNNGIKSINAHLGQDYQRLRVGVWNNLRDRMGDADFVLSSFSKAEQTDLIATIIPASISIIDEFTSGHLSPQSITLLAAPAKA